MNRLRLQNESGFTLIELLVVVAIIGILAAIAIPQFAAYRKRGHEAQVKSDLRNAAVAEEAYFAQNSAVHVWRHGNRHRLQALTRPLAFRLFRRSGPTPSILTATHRIALRHVGLSVA